MELADNLNTRFNIAIRSSSELEFYQNLYSYFDFIHKTPELFKIFDKSEVDYMKRHAALWKNPSMTEEEIMEAAAQTTKLERFNLFAIAASIYSRIYCPLDHYRNSNESDRDQDIVAVILMRGAGYAKSLRKWSKEDVKFYTRWFDGRRDYYERELRLFHAMFLDELAKEKIVIKNAPEAKGGKTSIYYHPTTGKGWAKNKAFTFKDHQPEFRLFGELYKKINKPVSRQRVLSLIGKPEGRMAAYHITNSVKKIRARTKLNSLEVAQNNGNITLVADKMGDFPNLP